MTDSQKIKLIKIIIGNAYEAMPGSKEKAAFLEGVMIAIESITDIEED